MENITWKGTTPEERRANNQGQMIGGLMHDFATVFAALLAQNPNLAYETNRKNAIDQVLTARREIEERING